MARGASVHRAHALLVDDGAECLTYCLHAAVVFYSLDRRLAPELELALPGPRGSVAVGGGDVELDVDGVPGAPAPADVPGRCRRLVALLTDRRPVLS